MIEVTLNRKQVIVPDNVTVATAVFLTEVEIFRRSLSGEARFPLCGMGICFECRVSINGVKHKRSCQILAEPGMNIETDE